MQTPYTLFTHDVEAYLATKRDEEIIGITCHATECLVARVARWKFAESVAVVRWTVHFANGSLLRLEPELECLYHRFDALNRGEIERTITKREWLEACCEQGKRGTVSKEKEKESEPPRESNPLGLFCLECQAFCVLSEDGKRWLCPNGHN